MTDDEKCEVIRHAIQEKSCVKIQYRDEGERVVEPHQLGFNSRDRLSLSAYQRRGFSRSGGEPPWRQFFIEEVGYVKGLDEDFTTRPKYTPGPNRVIKSVISQV